MSDFETVDFTVFSCLIAWVLTCDACTIQPPTFVLLKGKKFNGPKNCSIMHILIVEDHLVSALGIELLLKGHFNGVHVEIASNGKECLHALRSKNFDLVVLDLVLPGTDTTSLIQTILQNPNTKILALTSLKDEVFAQVYLQLGIHGYLNKHAGAENILLAVNTVLSDNLFIPSSAIKNIQNLKQNPFSKLSKREMELVLQLLEGKSTTEASKIMSIASNSTSTLKARALKKLGVDNVVDLLKKFDEYYKTNG